jgi:hypothetical protein
MQNCNQLKVFLKPELNHYSAIQKDHEMSHDNTGHQA